jgi:hypothetical protein
MYPNEVEAHQVKKKNEKGHSWFEVSMIWDRLELPVTGGFRGCYDNDTMVAFLIQEMEPLKELNGNEKKKNHKHYTNQNDFI